MSKSDVSSVVNHFATVNEGFATTTSSSILAGATSIPLTTVSDLTDGSIFVGIIEPGLTKQQVFTGTVDTAGLQITGVKWTRGSNVDHSAGVSIVDYVTGTLMNMIVKGLLVSHDQDGTLKAGAVDSAAVIANNIITPAKLTSDYRNGWITSTLPAVSSVTENGNRSADITFASTVASILTPGMRIRTSRTVAAPTYMGGAFNGTNHYFTKTTPTSTLSTVTNSFTLMAHIEPTSYATGRIMGRLDGTPGNGFSLYMLSDGRIELGIFNGGSANYRSVATYQSVPLNKKTHVAASWSSGTVAIYFDGISVPVAAATTGGTAPTTAGTGGDFSVGRGGAYNAQYFPGYISGVGAFNAVLSASTIRSYKNQALTGSETNCIGAWSLNNTGVNQQAAGTNDLTAMNSVGYTARSPYCTDANGVASGTYDWAIVTKVSTTTATVQYPEGCAIPTSGGVSAVDYAPSGIPFGFPGDSLRWRVESLYRTLHTQSSPTANTWYNMTSTTGVADGTVHTEPVGKWNRGYEAILYSLRGVSGTISHHTGLSTANNTFGDTRMIARGYASTILDGMHTHKRESPYNTSVATTLYLNVMTDASSISSIQLFGNIGDTIIYSDLAYL